MTDRETFQHYQVLRRPDGSLWELGRGAMGVTFKATDTSLQRPVALKVIRAESLNNERVRQRFVREARAAAGLNHPNVARVFHLGESAQSYFYAMEFIDGETLEACVRRRGPLPPRLALGIALQVANALRAAAKEGLVHRDIKPSNIMLLREEEVPGHAAEDTHVKVIDFGLAKAVRDRAGAGKYAAHATITVAGFVGTPHYASPEQLDEKELDARSDFYSLGVTLWYMLTGKPPFSGSVVQIMSQHLSRLPPYDALRDTAGDVVPLLRRLLEKDPVRRPQDAHELQREIAEALAHCRDAEAETQANQVPPAWKGEKPVVPADSWPVATQAFPTVNPWWKLFVVLSLLLGFVVIAGSFALAAWYLLGPDEPLPRFKGTEKPHRSTPPVGPAHPPGTVFGLRF